MDRLNLKYKNDNQKLKMILAYGKLPGYHYGDRIPKVNS